MSLARNFWDDRDPEEILIGTFDFDRDLGDDTIASVVEVSVAVERGEDAAAASMPRGAPQIVGDLVLQLYGPAVRNVDYYLRCKIATAAGQVLVLAASWPCRRAL